MKTRKYTQRRRAEQQAQTRTRIVEAAMALHEELGPRDTTITAIAERAGVQRLTVYRHFPDDHSLFAACTTHWLALNSPPDPAPWQDAADPALRCRAALSALYRYYRRTADMWDGAYRDVGEVEALQDTMQVFETYLAGIGDDLLAAWAAPRGRRRHLRAAIAHALRFRTWQSLAEVNLRDAEMAEMVTRWLGATARDD